MTARSAVAVRIVTRDVESRSTLPPRPIASLEEEIAAKVASGKLDLPLLPAVAAEVTALTARDDGDMKKLADVIRRDQAMAAHFLRMANSPVYRPRSHIVSLQQALSWLGLGTVRQIALAISCKSKVFVAKGYEDEAKSAFKHAFTTALFAQEIARARKSNVEEAFLAGLLHDVGLVVLLAALADLERETSQKLDRSQALALVERLHEEVGASLCRAWHFPERLAFAAASHHAPEKAKGAPDLAHVVALADALAERAEAFGEVEEKALRAHPAIVALNLYQDDFGRVLEKRQGVLETANAL